MNLNQIIEAGAGVSITISSSDLLLFAETLIQRTRVEVQKESHAIKTERMLEKKDVMELLGVCDTTLFYWRKKGYLKPVKVGNKVRYKWSEVSKVLEGRA